MIFKKLIENSRIFRNFAKNGPKSKKIFLPKSVWNWNLIMQRGLSEQKFYKKFLAYEVKILRLCYFRNTKPDIKSEDLVRFFWFCPFWNALFMQIPKRFVSSLHTFFEQSSPSRTACKSDSRHSLGSIVECFKIDNIKQNQQPLIFAN